MRCDAPEKEFNLMDEIKRLCLMDTKDLLELHNELPIIFAQIVTKVRLTRIDGFSSQLEEKNSATIKTRQGNLAKYLISLVEMAPEHPLLIPSRHDLP